MGRWAVPQHQPPFLPFSPFTFFSLGTSRCPLSPALLCLSPPLLSLCVSLQVSRCRTLVLRGRLVVGATFLMLYCLFCILDLVCLYLLSLSPSFLSLLSLSPSLPLFTLSFPLFTLSPLSLSLSVLSLSYLSPVSLSCLSLPLFTLSLLSLSAVSLSLSVLSLPLFTLSLLSLSPSLYSLSLSLYPLSLLSLSPSLYSLSCLSLLSLSPSLYSLSLSLLSLCCLSLPLVFQPAGSSWSGGSGSRFLPVRGSGCPAPVLTGGFWLGVSGHQSPSSMNLRLLVLNQPTRKRSSNRVSDRCSRHLRQRQVSKG